MLRVTRCKVARNDGASGTNTVGTLVSVKPEGVRCIRWLLAFSCWLLARATASVTAPCRDARSVRPSPSRPRCCNFRSTTDAQTERSYTATYRFDTTDAQIVRPYTGLLVSLDAS